MIISKIDDINREEKLQNEGHLYGFIHLLFIVFLERDNSNEEKFNETNCENEKSLKDESTKLILCTPSLFFSTRKPDSQNNN